MRKDLKASITVEASFLLPLVILILSAIMYLSFHLHDRCAIQSVVDKVLHKAELSVKHDSNINTGEVNFDDINNRGVFYLPFGSTKKDENNCLSYVWKELEHGLLITKIRDIQVSISKYNIEISVEAVSKMSLHALAGLVKPFPIIKIKEKGPIHNPVEQIRFSEVILETGMKIKGVEALKEKLEEFVR